MPSPEPGGGHEAAGIILAFWVARRRGRSRHAHNSRCACRRIGIVLEAISGDAEFLRRIAIFTQSLRELGWIEGRNLAIDTRYSEGKPSGCRARHRVDR